MKKTIILSVVLLSAAVAAIAYSSSNISIGVARVIEEMSAGIRAPKTMRPFKSEQDLKDFFKKLAGKQNRDRREAKAKFSVSANASPGAPLALDGVSSEKQEVDDSVTNT